MLRTKTVTERERRERVASYCFPDICAEIHPVEPEAGPEEEIFVPASLGKATLVDTVGARGSLETGRDDHKVAAKVAEAKRAAYEEGFEKGKREGVEHGRKEVVPVVNSLREALDELETIRAELHSKAEKEAVHLALAVARKILCHEVQANRAVVKNVIRAALKGADEQGSVTIRVNPADYRLLKDTGFSAIDIPGGGDGVELEEDDRIASGGCVISTDFGEIDARLEKQFEVVEEAFRAEFQKPTDED